VVKQPDVRINFLLSIREDALAQLDRFKGRIPNLFENYLRIDYLDRTAAREAIVKPLEEYNRRQAGGGQTVAINDALVEAVLEQVRTGQVSVGETGRGVVRTDGLVPTETRIETPYLQLVMTRLWQEEQATGSHVLRRETLTGLGGATEIVQTHLDGVMSALSPDEQALAAHVFQYLVTRSGTKVAYPVLDLADEAAIGEAQLAGVLEKLSRGDARILRQVGTAPGLPAEARYERYEIFHDVLASAVLAWRARYMQEQERRDAERRAEEQQRIEREKREQAEREAAEQAAQARRLRRLAIGLVTLAVLMIFLVIYAFQQRHAAEQAAADAQEQQNLALQAQDAAETAAQEAGRQKLKAEEQTRIATARQIAAQALSRYVRLDLGLLLSLEANRIANTVEGRGSLLEGLQRSPHLTTFLTGHTSYVGSVAFSPDGKMLASGSGDNTIVLWDVASRQPLGQPLSGHTNSVESVAFSPDGKTLASGSGDNTIVLWDVSFQSWQARACYIVNRNLTRTEWQEYIGDIEPYRTTCPRVAN
jgi:hypothetical protein